MLALLLILSTAAQAPADLDLAADPGAWTGLIGLGGESTIAVEAAPKGVRAVVGADGGQESHPILRRVFDKPQDWSRFTRLHTRVRLTCEDPAVAHKHFCFVFYDDKARAGGDGPMVQQTLLRDRIPVGQWVESDDWLTGIERSAVRQFEVYLYEYLGPISPPWDPYRYSWEFASLELRELGAGDVVFDGVPFSAAELKAAAARGRAAVSTDGGLRVTLGDTGCVSRVDIGGRQVGSAEGRPTGLLVRDVARGGPPVPIGGEAREADGVVRHRARVEGLGLGVEATYRSVGPRIEVSGVLRDLRGEDQAVTLYLALPVGKGWRWWDSISVGRSDVDERGEFANLETGRDYGLGGEHSKYPLGVIAHPERGGLVLALRMDEPVVHRIRYNPRLGLFYVALDFGLTPGARHAGRPLSEAPFRFLVYRSDPAWGMRSALQRYYDQFPQFFTKRVNREGAWTCWGHAKDKPELTAAGAAIDWGPYWLEQGRYSNEHGLLTLFYLCSEYYEQSMGDHDRSPTPEEAWERVRGLAGGDEAELAKVEKLYHPRIGGGHLLMVGMDFYRRDHTTRDYLREIARATVASVAHDVEGRPVGTVEKQPWIGDSHRAAAYTCNLDPDLPGGKGRFNTDLVLDYGFRAWEEQGVRPDGLALDIFGARGVNYRREHFPYADVPLSFSTQDHRPVLVNVFTSIEWLREVAASLREKGRVVMANSGSAGFLSFAAPYLDILGSETAAFADPDFARAVAYRKTLADLPYGPQPEPQVAAHLLHAVFPGEGSDLALLGRYTPVLRDLSAAGWEPITDVRVLPEVVRVERYGSGAKVWLVLHNPTGAGVAAELRLEGALAAAKRGWRRWRDGRSVEVDEAGRARLDLGAGETQVLVRAEE